MNKRINPTSTKNLKTAHLILKGKKHVAAQIRHVDLLEPFIAVKTF